MSFSARAVTTGARTWAVCLVLALVGCESGTPAPTATSDAAPERRAATEQEAAGISYVERITGGAQSEQPLPMLVAIHGLGDRPEDFARALTGLPASARIILPQGLTSHGRGYSWFDVADLDAPDGIERAANRIAAAIDVLVQRRPTSGRPVVTGFSQGGALSFALAARHPSKVSAALPVGGWLPAALRPSAPVKLAPPIFALHGAEDRRISVAGARDATAALEAMGYRVSLSEEPGVGHSISPAMRRIWFAELTAALGRAKAP